MSALVTFLLPIGLKLPEEQAASSPPGGPWQSLELALRRDLTNLSASAAVPGIALGTLSVEINAHQ